MGEQNYKVILNFKSGNKQEFTLDKEGVDIFKKNFFKWIRRYITFENQDKLTFQFDRKQLEFISIEKCVKEGK